MEKSFRIAIIISLAPWVGCLESDDEALLRSQQSLSAADAPITRHASSDRLLPSIAMASPAVAGDVMRALAMSETIAQDAETSYRCAIDGLAPTERERAHKLIAAYRAVPREVGLLRWRLVQALGMVAHEEVVDALSAIAHEPLLPTPPNPQEVRSWERERQIRNVAIFGIERNAQAGVSTAIDALRSFLPSDDRGLVIHAAIALTTLGALSDGDRCFLSRHGLKYPFTKVSVEELRLHPEQEIHKISKTSAGAELPPPHED
jgi:hypothetical protein